MTVKILESAEAVKKLTSESGSNLVVIHFAADWAPQCAQMNLVLQELSNDIELSSVTFAQVEAEAVPEISQQYDVSSVPTFVLIKNQVVVDKINGANAPKLTTAVKKHVANGSVPSVSTKVIESSAQDINGRLKKLINLNKCMLFIKGSSSEPKCGFSRQLIAILSDMDADYKTFDILSDEEVRQGLKEYSKWPTYPQVYVNGELIGGLDIIKELKETGELETTIPRKGSLEDRLKALINKDDVMVFMKGNRNQPRCGFSKQLVAILDATGIPYETFDILENEEVRQGLKTFSNWPTYPQVYVKGTLVGGLDIIKELQENEELIQTLKP
ncbi:hypothetical protein CHUAL_010045 [Chamberlinius hualienensis]